MIALFFFAVFEERVQTEYGIIHLVRSQNFSKNNISYPLIRTRTQTFSENFAKVLNEWSVFGVLLFIPEFNDLKTKNFLHLPNMTNHNRNSFYGH